MKFYILTAITALAILLYACAEPVDVVVRVVDDKGNPVNDADVAISFPLSRDIETDHVTTGSSGIARTSGPESFGVGVLARKDGYYDSGVKKGYGDQDLKMVLKRKRNPIAMYARRHDFIPPEIGKELGYDLLVGDYVTPYGSGITSDFLVTVNVDRESLLVYQSEILIRFPNPSDGLAPFYIESPESDFQSSYKAPRNGYKNSLKLYRNSESAEGPIDTNMKEDRNYYFRVRSETNGEGEIESAHYGKIYGEFPDITYYFNPTPNDRNVEYDVGKNLFDNLDDYIFNP